MAITYKTSDRALSQIFEFDGTSYSSNYAGTSAHDLFSDTAGADDILYFGVNRTTGVKFADLIFDIDVGLVADAIELKWEYWHNPKQSWEELTVTDSTNSFQTTGINTVGFAPPAMWGFGYSTRDPKPNNITLHYWVRCRIVSVTNLTEGGSVQDVIYSKDPTVIVTGNYANLIDSLYAEDDANGWGVISRTMLLDDTYYSYGLSVPVEVGDGSTSTTCTITQRIIEFGTGAQLNDTVNSNLTLSRNVLISHDAYSVTNVITLNYATVSYCTLINHANDYAGGAGGRITVGNSCSNFMIIQGLQQAWAGYGGAYTGESTGTHTNLLLDAGNTAPALIDGTASNVVCTQSFIYPRTAGAHVYHDFVTTNADIIFSYQVGGSGFVVLDNIQAPNADVNDPTKYRGYAAGTYYLLGYAVNFKVVDNEGNNIQGALITIENAKDALNYGVDYDDGSTNVGPLTTDVNGETEQAIFVHKKHYYTGTASYFVTLNTTDTYSPYTITISKTGYETKKMVIDMDTKREEIVVLQNRREV